MSGKAGKEEFPTSQLRVQTHIRGSHRPLKYSIDKMIHLSERYLLDIDIPDKDPECI